MLLQHTSLTEETKFLRDTGWDPWQVVVGNLTSLTEPAGLCLLCLRRGTCLAPSGRLWGGPHTSAGEGLWLVSTWGSEHGWHDGHEVVLPAVQLWKLAPGG